MTALLVPVAGVVLGGLTFAATFAVKSWRVERFQRRLP